MENASKAGKNQDVVKRICGCLFQLCSDAEAELMHGEVSIRVKFQDGVIQGFRDTVDRNNR